MSATPRISRDVLENVISQYVPTRTLASTRTKDPQLKREYEQRIQNILSNANDYELLIGSLETRDPRLLKFVFSKVKDEEDLRSRLSTMIVNSLNDRTFDLLIAANKYKIPNIIDYLPSTILFKEYYSDFLEEYPTMTDPASMHVESQFDHYLSEKYGGRDEIPIQFVGSFEQIFSEETKKIVENNSQFVWQLLNAPKYSQNIPVDLLLGDLSSDLSLIKKFAMLERIGNVVPERFEEYRHHIISRYPSNISAKDILSKEQNAFEFYKMLQVAYGFE